MIGLVLDTFYPNVFDTSVYLPESKVLERPELVKLLYMATKDKGDEFQIELIEEGDKYVLSMFSTDDKHSLSPTEFNDKDKALSRFESLEETVKSDFDIVEESNKSEFTNEFIFRNGGMIAKRKKVAKVMREFYSGNLKTRNGKVVEDRQQAIAIALSEAGLSKKEMGGYIASFDIPTYNTDLDRWALGDMNAGTSDSYFIR